ncbi:hypothetical protein OH784_23390 [Ectobacillus funiculus]|uniref:hypothetical protein n=1 Tax=Ectobacillus funiculus TaxID=137993 RepID=UPI00397D5EEB
MYKLEADFSADPIWCAECSYNFDLDDFPVSEGLKKELIRWAVAFQEVVDLYGSAPRQDAVKAHNDWGRLLTAQVKSELGDGYKVIFHPYS